MGITRGFRPRRRVTWRRLYCEDSFNFRSEVTEIRDALRFEPLVV
jgi:hypothetical protein